MRYTNLKELGKLGQSDPLYMYRGEYRTGIEHFFRALPPCEINIHSICSYYVVVKIKDIDSIPIDYIQSQILRIENYQLSDYINIFDNIEEAIESWNLKINETRKIVKKQFEKRYNKLSKLIIPF